jgi:hypothetical protein
MRDNALRNFGSAAAVEFVCPHCDRAIDPLDAYVLANARCRHCGGAVSLPGPVMATPPPRRWMADTADQYDPAAEASPEVRARVLRDLGVDNPGENLVGLHFLFENLIKGYVQRMEGEPKAQLLCIEACRQQIAIAGRVAPALRAQQHAASLPGHSGYHHLCLIRERQRQYEEAVRLAQEAREQGWSGDWDPILARCKKTTIQFRSKKS